VYRKTSIFAFPAIVAIVACIALGARASGAPVGLQYDEIARVAIGQATPPPPGAFKADLAAINNASSDQTAQQPPPKKRGLLGAILTGDPIGALSGDAMDNMAAKAMGGFMGSMNKYMAFIKQGKVAHYTFYNGWERVDDVAEQTATITKLDRNQIIELNLKNKTYRTIDPTAHVAEAEAPRAEHERHSREPAEQPQEPGTAVVDFSRRGTALGPEVLDGIPTTGFGNTVTLSMAQATGSCRNGSFSIASTQYYSKFAEPQIAAAGRPATLAERPAARVPTDPRSMVTQGGCTPTFTVHNSGPNPPVGRFMMYSNVSMQPQAGSDTNGSSFAFVTERGNVQSLPSSAASLFEIPADFTPEK
jgi:hypothetical protein